MPKVLLGLCIATLSMYIALQGQDLSAVSSEIVAANWWFLGWIAVIFMLQQALRAHRQMLLVRSSIPEHSFLTSFHILCVTFFFINTLPVRMGEVLRPILLFEKEDMAFGSATAVVFIERVLDLISAIIMLVSVLALANISLLDYTWIEDGQKTALFILPWLILLLLLPFYAHNLVLRMLSIAPIPKRINDFIYSFIEHVQKLRADRILLPILGETVIIWLMSAWMYVLGAMAFNIGNIVGYIEGLGLLAFTMIGMAAPSAPGFAGTYELAFVSGLEVFGSKQDTINIAFAICFHWWIYIVQSSSGIFFLARDKTSFRDIWKKIKTADAAKEQI